MLNLSPIIAIGAIGDPVSVLVGVSEHIDAERQNLNYVIGGIQWWLAFIGIYNNWNPMKVRVLITHKYSIITWLQPIYRTWICGDKLYSYS